MINKITVLVLKIWNSSTVMTWLSLLSKSLGLVLVTPLVLSRFSDSEIAFWLLIASALALLNMADLGFSTTFVRFLAYAKGGMKKQDIPEVSSGDIFEISSVLENRDTDWSFVNAIFSNMKFTYRWLALLSAMLMLFSTFLMFKPISLLENQYRGWLAWGVVLVSSGFFLQGTIYNSFLQGMNKVAVAMRVSAVFGLLTVLSNFTVLILGGDILALVLSNQIGVLAGLLGSYILCHKVENSAFASFDKKARYDFKIFGFVWGSAWKSGVGVFMSFGVQQIANLVIGQKDDSAEVASFLLAFMLIRQISQFSQAPFYSKIPLLAQLYVKKDFDAILRFARNSMGLTYLLIFTGALVIAATSDAILNFIGSDVSFVPNKIWFILLLSILVERYGAMHIQLYSISNKIIWHIANGISGLIFIAVFFLGFEGYGYMAFIFAMLASNIGFYSWYSANHSYKILKTNFWTFDKYPFLLIIVINILLIYVAE